MTGAQLPLYVILHVIMMTSYSCTAPDDDKFDEHCGLLAKNKTITHAIDHVDQSADSQSSIY